MTKEEVKASRHMRYPDQLLEEAIMAHTEIILQMVAFAVVLQTGGSNVHSQQHLSVHQQTASPTIAGLFRGPHIPH